MMWLLANKSIFFYLLIFVMSFAIMLWDYRGIHSKGFQWMFKSIIANYNLSMVVILKPQSSVKKAGNFISNNGFDRSHRVEAVGFFGGIWLLWKKEFVMHVKVNHK